MQEFLSPDQASAGSTEIHSAEKSARSQAEIIRELRDFLAAEFTVLKERAEQSQNLERPAGRTTKTVGKLYERFIGPEDVVTTGETKIQSLVHEYLANFGQDKPSYDRIHGLYRKIKNLLEQVKSLRHDYAADPADLVRALGIFTVLFDDLMNSFDTALSPSNPGEQKEGAV